MHKVIIGALILVGIFIAWLVVSGKATLESFSSKINNVPTLQDALNQTDKPLQITTSTQGLHGFPDVDRTNLDNSILTKNLITEDAIRQRAIDLLNVIQINTDTGTGAGIQTKSISATDFAKMIGLTPIQSQTFYKNVQAGGIKLVFDPTSTITSVHITQETINKAKADPQLALALAKMQNNNVKII